MLLFLISRQEVKQLLISGPKRSSSPLYWNYRSIFIIVHYCFIYQYIIYTRNMKIYKTINE